MYVSENENEAWISSSKNWMFCSGEACAALGKHLYSLVDGTGD